MVSGGWREQASIVPVVQLGLGLRPFKPATRVRIPSGTLLRETVAFLVQEHRLAVSVPDFWAILFNVVQGAYVHGLDT